MKVFKVTRNLLFFLNRLAKPIEFGAFGIIKRGQSSANNTTRLIRRDAQHERKKSRNGSNDDIIDIWRFKKLCF